MPTHCAEHDAPCCWTPCSEERGPHHGGRQALAAEATQRLSLAPGMRHRGRAAGRAAEGLRLRLWVGCGYHQTQTFTWPWPPLRLQTVRAKLVSRPIPARMAKAQWQVSDPSKDETHCSSPGRPSSTSFHGVVGRPAGSLDELRKPPAPTRSGVSVSLESEREHPPWATWAGKYTGIWDAPDAFPQGILAPEAVACPRGSEEGRDRGGGLRLRSA